MATEPSISATSEAAILGRLIRPDNGDLRAEVSVAEIIDVKTADSDQLIRGFGGNHHQLA